MSEGTSRTVHPSSMRRLAWIMAGLAVATALLTPFLALLLQGIPRSLKVDADLPAAVGTLAPLELAAVRIGDELVKIPDLEGLEQKLADAGLI